MTTTHTPDPPVDGRPRPQLWRPAARSLDGVWDHAPDPRGRWDEPGSVDWVTSINVPFAPGTPASGVPEGEPGLAWWYRRRVRFGGEGDVQVLHLGAVDHSADVWVDGRHVASHEGGYTPVRVRLAGQLASEGEHEVVVRAVDDPFDLSKPRGKQSWELQSRYVWYPRTSGIWQPVWTERLHRRSIASLAWRPDVARSALGLRVRLDGEVAGCQVRVRLTGRRKAVLADDAWPVHGREVERWIVVDRGAGDLDATDILWSPRRPVLLDAVVTLVGPDGEVLDEVESYAGLRSITRDGDQLLLNGSPLRHRLVLDQGYWPETGMTAPSDAALRRDVELAKELGFNGVRKHQKVEDPRYLHWADRLGLMVWAELPSAYRFDDVAVRRTLREWPEVVVRDVSHPSVVGWITFNESWGVRELAEREDQQGYVAAVASVTRALDPSRPVIANDGWEAVGGDVVGVHDYDLDVDRLRHRWTEQLDEQLAGYGPLRRKLVLDDGPEQRPVLLSEFGGATYGGAGWGYEVVEEADAFLALYRALMAAVRSSPRLAGFCYTQLTDTYQETNGLLTVDRLPKVPIEHLRAAVRGRGDAPPPWAAAGSTLGAFDGTTSGDGGARARPEADGGPGDPPADGRETSPS